MNNENKMIVVLPAPEIISNARTPTNKETVSSWSVIALDSSRPAEPLREIVTVRWYMGRSSGASVVYCCIWTLSPQWSSGSGKAGGYGYHKASAALQDAIDSAGIKLSSRIDGRGETAQRQALHAIAEAMGYPVHLIVEN